MDLLKRACPYNNDNNNNDNNNNNIFPGFSVQGTVLVNPFLSFTKTTDFFYQNPRF